MSQALSNDTIIKLTTAESSREIKKLLKKTFPHMEKLSVTCKNFSPRIKWVNGPSEKAVREVVQIFEGATLEQNGGDIIKGYKDLVEYNGKKIDFGIDYIFCERNLSPENEQIITKYVQDRYGEDTSCNKYISEKRIYDIRKEIDASEISSLIWMPIEVATQELAPSIQQESSTTREIDMQQTETCYISVADTAKLVRQVLKERFPGVKFSVKSRRYSMGASIDIAWIDGPCTKDVDRIVDRFKGAEFDGNQDLKVHRQNTLHGESVHFGADYIDCRREMSVTFLTRVAQAFCESFKFSMPEVKEQSTGAYLPNRRGNEHEEQILQVAWTVNESDLDHLTIILEDEHFAKAQKATKVEAIVEAIKNPQPSNILNFPTTKPTKADRPVLQAKEIDNEVFDVLRECLLESGVLYLPKRSLNRKLYEAVNEVLSRLGGKWNHKVKGHVFETDPTSDWQTVLETGAMPKKNPTAYYATPSNVGQDILSYPDIESIPLTSRRILEPSAGTGALAREIEAYCQSRGINATIDCCEIEPRCQQKLQEQGFFIVCDDFLAYHPFTKYDAIVMNPPFSVEGDPLAYITHIEHAWSLLAESGILIAIVPSGFTFRDDKRIVQFRTFVEQHGTWRNLEKGAFAESGTGVSTVVISIKKEG